VVNSIYKNKKIQYNIKKGITRGYETWHKKQVGVRGIKEKQYEGCDGYHVTK